MKNRPEERHSVLQHNRKFGNPETATVTFNSHFTSPKGWDVFMSLKTEVKTPSWLILAAIKHKKNPNTGSRRKRTEISWPKSSKNSKTAGCIKNQNIEWHAPSAVSRATKHWQVEIWKRSMDSMNLSSSYMALCGMRPVFGNGAKMCVWFML